MIVVRLAIHSGDLVALRWLGNGAWMGGFWVRLGVGLISSLFIQKDVIFWWVSNKNEKTLRDKMIATPNLKGVNHILV